MASQIPRRRAGLRRPPTPRSHGSSTPDVEPDHAPPMVARLLAMQRAAGNGATAELILMRHKVAGTPVHRHTKADLFDPPGTTFADFERSVEVQADWFAEPSLDATDRTDLHALLQRTREGPHILAGVGDVLLSDLRTVAAADW